MGWGRNIIEKNIKRFLNSHLLDTKCDLFYMNIFKWFQNNNPLHTGFHSIRLCQVVPCHMYFNHMMTTNKMSFKGVHFFTDMTFNSPTCWYCVNYHLDIYICSTMYCKVRLVWHHMIFFLFVHFVYICAKLRNNFSA